MTRIQPAQIESAQPKQRELFDLVKKKLGMVPNFHATVGNSPTALEAYLAYGDVLSHGELSPKVREQIALVVAQQNKCEYCISAHSALGKTVGLKEDELSQSRKAIAAEPKIDSILKFADNVVRTHGQVSSESLALLREHGVSDGEIVEIVALVSLNIFTNYINNVAETVVDFPKVAL
ncbi:MAG: carboxymuconolactone decarboxylase family protein [Bdellovibrionales bacterium]|nr:carboxymuconolactone decarboxylase family protein [Bdellovibrionales bacterium]